MEVTRRVQKIYIKFENSNNEAFDLSLNLTRLSLHVYISLSHSHLVRDRDNNNPRNVFARSLSQANKSVALSRRSFSRWLTTAVRHSFRLCQHFASQSSYSHPLNENRNLFSSFETLMVRTRINSCDWSPWECFFFISKTLVELFAETSRIFCAFALF